MRDDRTKDEPPTIDAQAEPAADADVVPPTPPGTRRSLVAPVIYGVGALVLILAVAWIATHREPRGAPVQPAATIADLNALRARDDAIEQKLDALTGRVTALEHRGPPETVPSTELRVLEGRVGVLETRPPPQSPPVPPLMPDMASRAALDALSARVDQLARSGSDTAALSNRIDALSHDQQSTDSTLSARLDTLAQNGRAADAAVTGRLDALAQQADAARSAAGALSGLADRAQRTARLQAAAASLAAGQALGSIPDAPAALARFADAPPPTEAGLRLSYPAAAAAAQNASRPDLRGRPFLNRLWARVQQAVTVREGDDVIVGDPAAGILARARQMLDAGDLDGAVAALGSLQGPAADAMRNWRSQAQSLLAARAALLSEIAASQAASR